jgi:hypothetical protein
MSSYILKETSSGKFTLVHRNSHDIRLHSGYDPGKEAERTVAGFSAGRSTVIAVSGIGLGYHIDCLKKKFPGTLICALEHDPEVVDITQKTYPHHLAGVPVITSASGLPAVFENLDIAGFRGIAHFIHRPSYMLYKNFYDALMKDMNQYASSKISDLLTRIEFEERWAENILSNLRHLFTSTRAVQLFGMFAGCPGIIVSAGPSLRMNVDLLCQMRDRALIVSVDTALKVLSKKNIVPHIVMSLDAQKQSLKHFLGAGDDRTALLADLVCFPTVLRSYSGKKIISTTSKYYPDAGGNLNRETTPLVGWIEKYAEPIGDIQSGGSVATSVFDFLLNLGCSPIILVGQDLAYTGREIHASGTYHNDEWLPQINRFKNLDTINQGIIRHRKIKYIRAYGGKGEVISDFVFDLYRGWFEDSARKVGVPVINASEGGAWIKHTEERTLAYMLEQCNILTPTPGEILDRLLSVGRKGKPERLKNAMRTAVDSLRKVQSLATGALANKDDAVQLDTLVNSAEIQEILQPFLRRTRTYLSRYAAAGTGPGQIATKDIISAVESLIPAMELSMMELEGLTLSSPADNKYG